MFIGHQSLKMPELLFEIAFCGIEGTNEHILYNRLEGVSMCVTYHLRSLFRNPKGRYFDGALFLRTSNKRAFTHMTYKETALDLERTKSK